MSLITCVDDSVSTPPSSVCVYVCVCVCVRERERECVCVTDLADVSLPVATGPASRIQKELPYLAFGERVSKCVFVFVCVCVCVCVLRIYVCERESA